MHEQLECGEGTHPFGTAQATATGRGSAEALLNRNASNVKISLCAVMTLTSHIRQSDGRDHACATGPEWDAECDIGQPSARISPG
jgi:hypothetical protein